MRDKQLLETTVFFRYFSSKNSDDNKKSYHTTEPNVSHERYRNNFYAFFIERELFFQIISCYIVYTCEQAGFFCSAK